MNKKKSNTHSELLQWLQSIIIAVVIALIIRGFIFEPVEVLGQSMENTLSTNQKLILYKLGYYFNNPQKGDIIVLQVHDGVLGYIPFSDKLTFLRKMYPFPKEVDYIKRVIAVPGDTIDIRNGNVYVNNVKLDEDYAKGKTYSRNDNYPKKIPENKVFVLGDNRENSSDSRQIGYVDFNKIKGKALFRFWPLKVFGKL